MKIKPGYKQTEVGVIPKDWDVKPISQVAPLQRGFDLPTREITHGPFPVVYSNGIEKYHDTAMVKGPGVITGRSGTLGQVHYIGGDYWPHNTTLWVTQFNNNHPKFIYYLYQSLRFERFASGSGVPTLNRNDAHTYRVALPSNGGEQRAIAKALSDVDSLLDGLDRLIAKKRAIKLATMQQLLTGKTRLPGFRGKWEMKQLGDVAQIKKGHLITRNMIEPGAIPVIAGGKQPAYFHASANRFGRTITIGASGSAGYVALYNEPIFASDCFTISESENYCLDFVFYQLLSKQQAIYNAKTGGAQPHVYAKDLNPILLSLPSLPEQTGIAAVLSDMDAEIAALEARRDKTRALKYAMMGELLTGKTRLVKPKQKDANA